MGKNRDKKEILKNEDKPYKFWTTAKKIFAGIIVAVIVAGVAIGLAVGLTGNNNNPTPTPPGPGIEQPSNPGGSEVLPPDGSEIEKPDPGPVDPENPGGSEIEKPDPDPGPGGDENENPDPEVPPVEESKIENMGDLIANHGSTIYDLFTNKFQEGIGKKVFGKYFVEENLISVEWDLGGDDVINEIKFIATYKTSEDTTRFAVGKINIDDFDLSGKTMKDFETHINKSTPTYTNDYVFAYINAEQQQFEKLTNAICDNKAIFQRQEGEEVLERYIIDNGPQVDTELETTVRQFKVVEVTNYQVKEIGISIKDPQCSVDEFIKKLDDPTNYITYGFKDNVKFSGNKLEKTEENKVSLANFVFEMPDGSFFELA